MPKEKTPHRKLLRCPLPIARTKLSARRAVSASLRHAAAHIASAVEATALGPAHSVALAKSIAKLKKRCKKLGIPAIYVNDNRGRWRSDISAVLRHACVRDPRLRNDETARS